MNKLSVNFRIGLFLILLSILAACTPRMFPVSEEKSLKDDVYYLASGNLEGRKAGEKGDSLAAVYIRDRFQNTGLKLLFDKGLQSFSLTSSVKLGDSNRLNFNGKDYEIQKDYLPYSFSSSGSFSGKVAFVGYGFNIQTDSLKWDDYANQDVKGKWVLILKGDPEIDKSVSVFEPYSGERAKVLAATDHQAAGILLVGGPAFNEKDQLQGLFYDKNSSSYPVPVFQITRKLADDLLASSHTTIAALENKINTSGKPFSFNMDITVNGQADVIPQIVNSHNVVAVLPGRDPRLKNQYLVIGAHLDHLGWGGPGSGSRSPDTLAIHYGADDNASGVTAVLDLAKRFALSKNNRRSMIFAAFGAEEMGLIGSKAFVEHSPVDLNKIVAMFNFDMVGRFDTTTKALSIGGTKTSRESEEILNRSNTGFYLAFSGEGTGPSDHSSFYIQNIPVFFFSTGAHPDYHTPGDTPDKINYDGIRKVDEFASKVVQEVSNRDSALTFREAGPKMVRSRGGRFKVTLGIMPDFAGIEKRGLRVDAVSKGKPAEKAGIQKGDIITAIDGKTVGNIYDYMNRLKTFAEGQTISVDIIRNDKQMVLIVQL